MMKEISMQEISEMNTAYIELSTPDTKRAAYVLADQLKLNNFKIIDAYYIRLIFILAAAGELETDETMSEYGESMLKSGVELFTNMCFVIFTCTMLASFIVSAYKNKTMNLMFSYPISRKKILLSQML